MKIGFMWFLCFSCGFLGLTDFVMRLGIEFCSAGFHRSKRPCCLGSTPRSIRVALTSCSKCMPCRHQQEGPCSSLSTRTTSAHTSILERPRIYSRALICAFSLLDSVLLIHFPVHSRGLDISCAHPRFFLMHFSSAHYQCNTKPRIPWQRILFLHLQQSRQTFGTSV